MLGSVYGYTRCPNCGLSVPTSQLRNGGHTCNIDNVVAHQTLKARKDLETIETDITEYMKTERAQKLLAFARWRLQNGR